MKNRFQSLVAAAMESIEDENLDNTDAVQADPQAHDAAVADVEESHREVEAAVSDTETLTDVSEGIESLIASLEGLQAPLNSRDAVYMNIAAESHLARVGLDMSDTPMIASFENEEGGKKATGLSTDALKNKLRAIWEAIKNAFKKVWTAIVNFFKNVINANQHLDERATALLAAVGKASGDAGEKEIDLGTTFHRLQVDGKVEGIKHLADVVFLAQDLSHNPANEIAQGAKFTLSMLHAKDEAGVDAVIEKLKEIKYEVPKSFSASKENSDGTVTHLTNELPGGLRYGVAVQEPGKAKDGIDHLKKLVKSINLPTTKEFHKNTDKAPTLSLNDIRTVAESAKLLAKQGAEFKAGVQKTADEIEKLGTQLADGKTAQVGEAGARKIAAVYRALAAYGQHTMKIAVDAAVVSVRIGRGYVAYAEKSLAQYGAAEAASEPKEAKKDDVAEAA